MSYRRFNLGDGETIRNTAYDFASQPTSQVGANGHTYLALGSGPADGMTKHITDAAVISSVLSTEFKAVLSGAGLTVEHIEIYKIPQNYDGYPQCGTDGSYATGIIEQWDGDELMTGEFRTTGKDAYAAAGNCDVFVNSGQDGSNQDNWLKCSDMECACCDTGSEKMFALDFKEPVNSKNGPGAIGWAICVFLNGVYSIDELEAALPDNVTLD